MTCTLDELRGLRSAPPLSPELRQALLSELGPRLAACDWFTIGVMAASGAAATAALGSCETALGWRPLELDPASAHPNDVSGPAFLKGNQNTGRFLLRPEPGLGEGILITGHSVANPEAEDTWGPLPLDLFRDGDN
ncbi:MAG: DUF1824 family protein [Cyanobacteria bacterium M_surface_7_m2_040]|nr:DUF1824 family protein [Cyanobacteria bacterium M_surface_9_m1_291]MBM5828387.1 DUF1824 family protein [Cyanobacteria bacterium M_surface_7_m2_040]